MEFHSHPSPVIRLLPLYINAADQKRMKSNSQDSFVMKTRISIHRFLVSLVLGIEIIYGLPSVSPSVNDTTSSLCFPSLGFKMPTEVPSDSIISQDKWWCSPTTEHAFLGFSYEITACMSLHFVLFGWYTQLFTQAKADPNLSRSSRTCATTSTLDMFVCMGFAIVRDSSTFVIDLASVLYI
jgi:hypothetical protein